MLILSSLLLALPCVIPQDQILTTSGSKLLGKLTTISKTEVQFENAAEEAQTLSAAEVIALHPQIRSELMLRADSFLAAGDFQNAVNTFELASSEVGADWLAPLASLRHGESLLAWAVIDGTRAAEAKSTLEQWLTQWPDHFWSSRARIALAPAQAATGDADGATAALQALADEAFNENLGEAVLYRATMARCRIYHNDGQAQIAESRIKDLISKLERKVDTRETPSGLASLFSEISDEARTLLGDSLLQKGGFSAARTYWESVLRNKRAGASSKASAKIGLALEAIDKGELRKAQLLLAGIIATLPNQSPAMAHALFVMGQVSSKNGDTPTPGSTYWNELIDSHPGSPWAVQARQALGN